MLSKKRLIVERNFTKPGHVLHTADRDEFVTIKVARASTDAGQVEVQEPNDTDMFRISIGEEVSIWITLKSIKDGIMLESFPISHGESLRISSSQSIVGKFIVFGYCESE